MESWATLSMWTPSISETYNLIAKLKQRNWRSRRFSRGMLARHAPLMKTLVSVPLLSSNKQSWRPGADTAAQDSDLEVIGLWPTSLVRPKKMGTRERQRQPRTSRPGPLTSPGPSQFTSVASMGARRSLPRASGKSSKMKQRGVEQTSIASPAEVRASQPSPVRAFLGELAYPLGRLGDAIIAFGITTNLELDVFSGMREEWVLLQAFLFEKHGVTPLEWIVLKSGLEARAAKQNTH